MSWIDLAGAHNARDLGGLQAGRRWTGPNVLLRADALDGLTAADVAELVESRGLAHVVDLRSGHERVERGRGALGSTPVRYTEVEVIGPDDLVRRAEARASAFARAEPAARIIADGYVELLDIGAPALVHCAIGKDRTGVLVALLLDLAGVDRDEIVADYARTGERMGPVIARWVDDSGSTINEQVAAFSALAAPATMAQVLEVLHERWGGAAGFFAAHGVPAADLDRWREKLLA